MQLLGIRAWDVVSLTQRLKPRKGSDPKFKMLSSHWESAFSGSAHSLEARILWERAFSGRAGVSPAMMEDLTLLDERARRPLSQVTAPALPSHCARSPKSLRPLSQVIAPALPSYCARSPRQSRRTKPSSPFNSASHSMISSVRLQTRKTQILFVRYRVK